MEMRKAPKWIRASKSFAEQEFSVFSSSGRVEGTVCEWVSVGVPSAQLTREETKEMNFSNNKSTVCRTESASSHTATHTYRSHDKHTRTRSSFLLSLLTHAGNDMSLFLVCKNVYILFTLRLWPLRVRWSFGSRAFVASTVHVRIVKWQDFCSNTLMMVSCFHVVFFCFCLSIRRDAGQFTWCKNRILENQIDASPAIVFYMLSLANCATLTRLSSEKTHTHAQNRRYISMTKNSDNNWDYVRRQRDWLHVFVSPLCVQKQKQNEFEIKRSRNYMRRCFTLNSFHCLLVLLAIIRSHWTKCPCQKQNVLISITLRTKAISPQPAK